MTKDDLIKQIRQIVPNFNPEDFDSVYEAALEQFDHELLALCEVYIANHYNE